MPKLKFKNGIVDDFTFILSTRDYRHIGKLTGLKNISYKHNENSADTLSFVINKYSYFSTGILNNKNKKEQLKNKQRIWSQIVDFKLVYIKELDEYFELRVSLNDSSDVTKNVQCTSLCEAELSQLNITIGINTDSDIDINGQATTICNFNNTKLSAIHRILKDKAPHYTVGYVDESLMFGKDNQRTFDISNKSIYDFLVGEFSEQFHCIVKFDSAHRKINIYDLYTKCNDCDYYGDYYGKCPECGSTNLESYYGKDTSIHVNKNNLTDGIQLEVNADNIKNCFKLEAGDDKIQDALRLLNPNGSDYIYYITEYQRSDMPKSLRDKLDAYNELYNSVLKNKFSEIYSINSNELFKTLSNKLYPKDDTIELNNDVYVYENMTYTDLLNEIDNAQDKRDYYQITMMPNVNTQNGINASTEVAKLTQEALSPLGMSKLTENTVKSTVNIALLNYAKIHVLTGYVKVEIIDDNYTYNGKGETWNEGVWTGRFKITNYSDEEDIVYTDMLTIQINDNEEEFINQKVLKTLQIDDEKYTVFDALGIEDLNKFKDAITLYSFNRLTSFYDSINGAIDTLELLKSQSEIGEKAYKDLIDTYKNKKDIVEREKDKRELSWKAWDEIYTTYNNLRLEIQNILNFEKYLDKDYTVFCMYRREDVYSNPNFISDGLTDFEINKRANEFLEIAKEELYKSAEQQVSISSTLYNLLVMEEFQPIVNYFESGNWIRITIDNVLYTLRLISYEINFDNIQTLNVEFANATKNKSSFNIAKNIINTATSMAKNYNYISKQANAGNTANSTIQEWMADSLNTAKIQIQNSENADFKFDKYGLLGRMYDDTTGEYSPQQIRFTYNNILYTNDNWNTVSMSIGYNIFRKYIPSTDTWVDETGYGQVAEYVMAGQVTGSVIVGGTIYSDNYSDGTGFDKDGNQNVAQGSWIDLDEGYFSFAGGRLVFDGKDLLIDNDSVKNSLTELGIINNEVKIPASNITGELSSTQIKSIDASQVTSGTLLSDRIPNLDASKITSGEFESRLIPNLNANKISNGTFAVERIPNLDVSKVTTGTWASNRIDSTLSNKTISGGSLSMGYTSIGSTGEFNTDYGYIKNLQTHSITVYDDSNTARIGITGTYEIGESSLTFIDGVLVSVG